MTEYALQMKCRTSAPHEADGEGVTEDVRRDALPRDTRAGTVEVEALLGALRVPLPALLVRKQVDALGAPGAADGGLPRDEVTLQVLHQGGGEADPALAIALAQNRRGAGGEVKVGDLQPQGPHLVEGFLDYGRNVRHYTGQTLVAYGSDLNGFTRFLEERCQITDPRAVTSAHVEDFLQARPGISPATKCWRLDAVSTLFKYLVRRGLADRNPTENVPRPKKPHILPKWVPPAEVEALRNATRGTLEGAVFEALAGLGLRRAEALGLRLTDFHWQTQTLRVMGKGRRERDLPLSQPVRKALKAYLRERPPVDSDTLFITRRGVPMTEKVIRAMIRRWCKRAGLADRGYTLHSLRHGFATELSRRGVDVVTIRDLLGHENIATTSLYLHSDVDRKRAAVALLYGSGQRVPGDGAVEVVHREAQVVRRRVKPGVPKEALDGVQITPALQKKRGARMAQTVKHDAGPVYAGAE